MKEIPQNNSKILLAIVITNRCIQLEFHTYFSYLNEQKKKRKKKNRKDTIKFEVHKLYSSTTL